MKVQDENIIKRRKEGGGLGFCHAWSVYMTIPLLAIFELELQSH